MSIKKPLISVIIPVYNVEQYIESTIRSVIEQTIGFEQNIEVVVVNDGSTDNTGDICQKYRKLYPNNIFYLEQNNIGVSAARNKGLEVARGKYINFLDADDIWQKNAFSKAILFLKKHTDVDFVAAKIKLFDADIAEHPLNYKFTRTRVIDVKNEPDAPVLHVITCIFRRAALENRRFDEKLKISEDAKLLSDVLYDKKKYGVLSNVVYFYRKRSTGDSAIGGKHKNKDWYTITPQRAYAHMMKQWSDDKGVPDEFIQHTLLYELSYRLMQKSQNVLTSEEENDYKSSIFSIIKKIDDRVIAQRLDINIHTKLFLYKIKYGLQYKNLITSRNGTCYVNENTRLQDISELRFYLDFIHCLDDDAYQLEGYITGQTLGNNDQIVIDASGVQTTLTHVRRSQRELSFLGDEIYDGGAFEVQINISSEKKHRISAQLLSGDQTYDIPIITGKFTGIGSINKSYHQNGKVLLRKEHGMIRSYPVSLYRKTIFESIFLINLLFDWRLSAASKQFIKLRKRNLAQLSLKAKVFEISKPLLVILETVAMIPRAFILRLIYRITKKYKKNPIWLISDRGMAAGDNGEAVFRYAMSQPNQEADIYFVISKKSTDYNRMKEYGRVLDQNSLRYKLKFLLSDKIISSHADIEITNPFIRQIDHFVDLFSFDFIFLQHGVIRHDLSDWLNRFEKNISLFVVSAEKEYESLLAYPYYYTEKQVLLSGLPRYDLLTNDPKQSVIIAPTYRKNLAQMPTDKNGKRLYSTTFKSSEYYGFYNNLLNDNHILETLKSYDMKAEFYLHPALEAQATDFNSNACVAIHTFPYDYKKAFKEGRLLVSDYSSVVFDFAYLKKPVIYTRFDNATFYENQSYNEAGFFSDEKDGFGPVTYTYVDLVESIVDAIKSGCVMQQKYKKRVDEFYAFNDKNNTKRVYEAIINKK